MPDNLVFKINKILMPACLAMLLLTSEWLFQVTKPSFFSVMGIADATIVLFISASTVCISFGLPFVLAMVIGEAWSKKSLQRLVISVANIAAGMISATLILLLVDNFAYTVFGVGISTSTSTLVRLYYLSLWVLLIYYFVRIRPGKTKTNGLNIWPAFSAILVTMIGILLMLLTFDESEQLITKRKSDKQGKEYNVLILSSDGVESANMSVYGYERDTTPFLRSIEKELFISDNSFVNNGRTTGSVISLLTGVMPTTSRVSYPPDILDGFFVTHHWPGIMLQRGYKTLDVSARYYADPFDLHMRNGFSEANFRSVAIGSIYNVVPSWYQAYFPESAYFMQLLIDKITDALGHILFISDATNPFKELQEGLTVIDDSVRIEELTKFIDSSNKVFAHVHLMETHGSMFTTYDDGLFARGKVQDQPWMTDFYDDAVLRFDRYIEQVYRHLESKQILENTIIVVTSDHGKKWRDGVRVPLLIRFPGKMHSGRLSSNTQRIDIAPTILDFLNIEVPEWMEGRNILKQDDDSPISSFVFSVNLGQVDCQRKGKGCAVTKPDPEFGSIGKVSVIICNQYYQLTLKTGLIKSNRIEGYNGDCLSSEAPNDVLAGKLIVNHLLERGYSVSRKALSDYVD